MKKLISRYKNGNYNVAIFEDGTKIRFNDLDNLKPDFPESMDMKISNYCPFNCPMCHEKSSTNGKYGNILNNNFIKTIHENTELALGGGAVTFHPDLIPFLNELKQQKIITSITINQQEWDKEKIGYLIDNKLIYGLGVSFVDMNDKIWDEILSYPNSVVHLIAGYHSKEVFEYFANRNTKILILGYKTYGRGINYYENNSENILKNIQDLKEILPELFNKCKVVSFDNLSIKQLDIRNTIGEEKWKEFYMGDDGAFTMYVDMVENKFARNSTSEERFDIGNYSSKEVFDIIRNNK